jgi:hypothetical protein
VLALAVYFFRMPALTEATEQADRQRIRLRRSYATRTFAGACWRSSSMSASRSPWPTSW